MYRYTAAVLTTICGVILAATTACAGNASAWAPHRPVSNDILTGAEITREAPQNAYTAVERLRPFFMQARPSASDLRGQGRQIHVFIDGEFAGDLDVLKLIPASDVESITRVQPELAYTTMGATRAADGVLMVRLRCRVAC